MAHKIESAFIAEAAIMLREDDLAGWTEVEIQSGIITVPSGITRCTVTVEGGQDSGDDAVTYINGLTENVKVQFRPTYDGYDGSGNRVTFTPRSGVTGNLLCMDSNGTGISFRMDRVNDRYTVESNGTYAVEQDRQSNQSA